MHEDSVIRGRELEYTLAELRVAKGYNQTWYATAPTEIEFYVMKFIRYLPVNQKKAERQMKTLQGLTDKNIMIIYETFLYEDKGMKYLVIVSQFYRHGSLLRRIRSRKWDYDHKVRCLFQAACGLQYLHSKNIMHRNIKPENIFRWDKIAKLGDLGVAKELDGSHMTSGLAGYIHMAPQVYDRDEYGLEADIWSLGIVFIEVVLSRELNHIHKWRDSPSQEMDILEPQFHRLPGTIAKLVGGMLQIDREKRVKIDHVVEVMAKVVGLDLVKYRELPLEHFKRKQKSQKKKKEEPIINSKEDLIKHYNNGQPIFPDMPQDFDKNKLIPKFQDIVLPEITDEEIEREIEQAKKNPKPKPDPSKNPMGRMGPMGMGGMGGMGGMRDMMGMNRFMGMGGGMGDMMGSLGGMSDMMAGMGGMGGMGGRSTGESRKSNMGNDFMADLMNNLNNASKKEPPSLSPTLKQQPNPMPPPKVEERPKTATITVKAPLQSQRITKPQVAPQVPQPPLSPQKIFKKKNVVYPQDGKQTKIKINPNAKPNNQQSERVKVIDNQDAEAKTPQQAQKKVKVKKNRKEDTSQNGNDSQPQAKTEEIKPKKKKKASETSDLQEKKPQRQQKKPEIQKQIQVKPQKPNTKKKADSNYQSGAQSQLDKPKLKPQREPSQITLSKEQKKKKKFQSSTDEQGMLNEEIKPKKKKEESKTKNDQSSGQNRDSKKRQKKEIETAPPGPKIETPEHIPQVHRVNETDTSLINIQKKPDFRQKQVENNLPASYIGSEKSTSDKQSAKGNKKPRPKFGVKPQPVVQAPKQDFQKLAKIHEQAVQHSYKQAERKFGINFAKKEEEMRQSQGASQREREERERIEGEQRRREMQKLRMQKRMERRKERQELGLPPLDEQLEEYMQQKQFGKMKKDYGTRAHPYQQHSSMRGMQQEMEMGMPMNRRPSTGMQMARGPPRGMPRQSGQAQGPPPPPRPRSTIDQLAEQIYILESGDSTCQEIAVKYIQLARLYSQTHLYKKATEVLANALRNLQAIDEVASERVAEIHFELGNAYLNTQSPQTALKSLTMARQTRSSLGIPESDLDIAIVNSLGVASRQLGQKEQAKKCYQEAIKKAHQDRSNPFSLVNPLSNLAGILHEEGNTQQALKILKEAQGLLKQAQLTGEGPYTNISQSIIELLFAMKNSREGLREINLLFRLYIDNRRTVQAEYYRFRERALKHIISTMSKNRLREELTLIEGLLSEYYEDQRKLAEKLRERLYREGEQGVIDEMEGLD